jgi:hypothetical protein
MIDRLEISYVFLKPFLCKAKPDQHDDKVGC